MEDLITRPYRPDDAAAIADLANQVTTHAGGSPDVTPTMVTEHFVRIRDVGSDSRVIWAPDGTLVAAGDIRPPPDGGHLAVVSGGVHPRWRGRGLGRELLGWQLARVGAIRRETAPAAGWEVHVGMIAGDEDAARLYRRFGMSPVRYWVEMAAPTAGAAERRMALPDGLQVVGYAPEYEPAVHQAHMEAFADHWGYQYRERDGWAVVTVRSQRFRPALSLLALTGDEVAGYLLSYESSHPDRLYIGQVGTRPAWRRRGLATALLVRTMALAARAGLITAELGVDADSPTGAVGVYERVGFAVTERAVTYAAALAAAPDGR